MNMKFLPAEGSAVISLEAFLYENGHLDGFHPLYILYKEERVGWYIDRLPINAKAIENFEKGEDR